MTTWALGTNNDPLKTTRRLLQHIWETAGLEGMLIPVYQAGGETVKAMLINDPNRLVDADPFVPVMPVNAGKLAAQLMRKHTHTHRAAVLRACEIRALDEHIKADHLNLENWLIIGVDCVACFPAQDFGWRVEKTGSVEMVTRSVLRNARQGGIAPYRFRFACQMCSHPEPSHVDMCIQLLGLPVRDTILVEVRNEIIGEELNLQKIMDGPAPATLISQRARMLKNMDERRQHTRAWKINELPPDIPENIEQLTTFLMNCQPCAKCMEACPVHADELVPAVKSGNIPVVMMMRWLRSCAECGMCEQACPKEMPLAVIMKRISQDLKHEAVTA